MVIVFGCGGVSPSYGDNSYPGFSLCYGVSLMVLVLYYNTSLRFGVSLCYTVCLCYCDVMPCYGISQWYDVVLCFGVNLCYSVGSCCGICVIALTPVMVLT